MVVLLGPTLGRPADCNGRRARYSAPSMREHRGSSSAALLKRRGVGPSLLLFFEATRGDGQAVVSGEGAERSFAYGQRGYRSLAMAIRCAPATKGCRTVDGGKAVIVRLDA